MGVAFDATIVSVRADTPEAAPTARRLQFADPAIAAGIDAARLAGARVINISLGGSQPGPALMAAISGR